MSSFYKAVLLIMMIALSSCATVFSGTTQKVNVMAIDGKTQQPLKDVACYLIDGQGAHLNVQGNPGIVLVTRSSGSINPVCKKDGYTQKSFGVGNSFNGLTFVNVLFWPGFIVDAATGAIHKLPSHITVVMEQN